MNFIPKMNLRRPATGYQQVLNQIYSPEGYYERVRDLPERFQSLAGHQTAPDTQEITALFRSIYLLGITGVGRIQYWKLFFWTLFRRPKLFPLAITFSIYGIISAGSTSCPCAGHSSKVTSKTDAASGRHLKAGCRTISAHCIPRKE